MLCVVTADSGRSSEGAEPELQLVLCALDEPLAAAWQEIADDRAGLSVHRGSVLDLTVDAVVSPANSYGWMRGGIDAVYARAFPEVEEQVRSAVLAYHGGELPVGEALLVPTGAPNPIWLISAPTMREPGELLPADTVHPYLAARAVLRLWASAVLENGALVRQVVRSIAMPGLGTGVGGVAPDLCARQIAAAWDEVFTHVDQR
ncbi:O-acetyl-ADP-ribose deacetylase (regulator of RNase III), contains Macro domain [Saccharopolyspora antimicrobica]|uniref:O-acetyl-ADP-ribose deacetylase (Regulator of RNase III) n=1 Tax=Saccharopolyspora antimicrobica TaxID=455193 RepID=A0A1I4X360_9PSEU|nr:O-acetyl-ADP-ribose deacetylase (regulator of RNase III) [Saccharopolyspora antimicrobica]SFN19679.1 O-acetyl-ADP-ribose deacetylase (regulator of RNase III), contains Macro domain [Saccharopolyspora antimicrobica]